LNNPKKILIVDDEALIAEHLALIIKKHFASTIKQAHHQKAAINLIAEFKPDIVLLDIRLDKNSEGIELAQLLNQQYHIPFLYITSFAGDAIMQQAMATKPLAFITKPFKEADIKAAIYLALNYVAAQQKSYFTIKDSTTTIKLQKQDILFAETTNDNYIQITTKAQKYLIRNSLDWLLVELQDDNFIRIHRSYIVNINAATAITSTRLIVQNTSLPISRKHKEEVLAFLIKK
jgi:DNA-binding LytR/AlgR family response regulator